MSRVSRSKAARKAWRTRRRKHEYKGICPVCHKPVWVRGVKRNGRWYHKRCWEYKTFWHIAGGHHG